MFVSYKAFKVDVGERLARSGSGSTDVNCWGRLEDREGDGELAQCSWVVKRETGLRKIGLVADWFIVRSLRIVW